MRSKKDKNSKIKLHIGCGDNYLYDWINIDDNSENYIQKLNLDLNLDFKKPLPFKENCVDVIYDERFLERLELGDDLLISFLKNIRNILKQNGLFRIMLSDMRHEKKLKPWLKKLGFPKLEFCEPTMSSIFIIRDPEDDIIKEI